MKWVLLDLAVAEKTGQSREAPKGKEEPKSVAPPKYPPVYRSYGARDKLRLLGDLCLHKKAKRTHILFFFTSFRVFYLSLTDTWQATHMAAPNTDRQTREEWAHRFPSAFALHLSAWWHQVEKGQMASRVGCNYSWASDDLTADLTPSNGDLTFSSPGFSCIMSVRQQGHKPCAYVEGIFLGGDGFDSVRHRCKNKFLSKFIGHVEIA